MFNTLMYTKKLEQAGMAREQAEAQMQILAEILEVDVATKSDIKNLEHQIANLDLRMSSLETKLGSKIDTYRSEFKNELILLEHRLITKLGTVIVVTATALTTIIKLF